MELLKNLMWLATNVSIDCKAMLHVYGNLTIQHKNSSLSSFDGLNQFPLQTLRGRFCKFST
jgi:hypothetical protein